MLSVKLLTETPAMRKSKTAVVLTKTLLIAAETHRAVLTFKEGVQDSLFDLGFFYHIGSRMGEDKLSWSRFKTIPIVLNNWHTVLQQDRSHLSALCLM